MMSDPGSPYPSRLGLLLRTRTQSLRNHAAQVIRDAPIRILATSLLVLIIWFGLYCLFFLVFWQFRNTPLEAAVAIPLVFNFFFVAMLALLTFSNALIAYGMLFGRGDSVYLMAAPIRPLDLVTFKYIESLAMSSWSLVVLGLPLMLALADISSQPVLYPIFIAFFVAFIPIPGALGVLLAMLSARYLPRRTVKTAVCATAVMIVVFLLWGIRMLKLGDMPAHDWLNQFLARMSFVEAALLPNNWVARGIDNAMQNRLHTALCYLLVTLANALLLSLLAVRFAARHLSRAYDRASASRGTAVREASSAAGGLPGAVFAYLPRLLRLVAAKDLRTFLRDPLQWGQLAILFGLMMLYFLNMPALHLDVPHWQLLVPFLNLCAVSLILATFTCRFVFPLVSLEGQKLWLIGLLPMPRRHVLYAKFAFAMTVTTLVAMGAMMLAAWRLKLSLEWALVHLGVTFAVCFGLCGFSVGIGARLPMFHQSSLARIANGMGGLTNLFASIALITVVLTGVAVATVHAHRLANPLRPDGFALGCCAAAMGFAVFAGMAAMYMGARHFERAEV